LRAALDGIVLRNLRYVSVWVSLLYLVFLISHLTRSPQAVREVMPILDVTTSLILISLYAAITLGRVPPHRSHLLSAVVACLLLATDVVHYVLGEEPGLTMNMILIEIGVGSFFLSLKWFAATSAIILLAWLTPTIVVPDLRSNLADYGILFLVSIVLSALIQTSRIRSLIELELSNLRFRRLSDASREGIAIFKNGIILDVNQKLSTLSGYARSELIGKQPDFLFASQNGLGRKKDGSTYPIERSTQIITPGTQPIIAIALWDISERKAAEKIIDEQRMKMIYSAKMSALGEMAAGISHEIKNPLTAIMAGLEFMQLMMARGNLAKETTLKLIKQAHSDGARINKIINGLYTFARDSESDQFERASLKTIIEESISLTDERAKRQGITLILDPIPENLIIECRPTQVSQILLNILSNAFDAIEGTKHKWVKISTRDLGENAEIGITDSGRGIPPEIRNKIMQPFFTTKGPRRGTGLGLSISTGLVERHHGTLELDPTSEHTRFVVRIPKKQSQPAERAA